MTPRQSLRVVAEDTSPSAAPQPPSAAPERPRTLPPWWEYQDSSPLDVWSLPNMAARPGDPGWHDPIDPHDLGPLSDERRTP